MVSAANSQRVGAVEWCELAAMDMRRRLRVAASTASVNRGARGYTYYSGRGIFSWPVGQGASGRLENLPSPFDSSLRRQYAEPQAQPHRVGKWLCASLQKCRLIPSSAGEEES